MKANRVFDRHVVVHQQRQQFAEDIADHQNETQHRDRERDIHDQFATDEFVDQLHNSRAATDGHRLAQISEP